MSDKNLRLMLSALECPFVDNIDFNSFSQVIDLIKWLEDCKIRQLEVNDRKILNFDNDIDKYLQNLSIYFNEIKCPYGELYSKQNNKINSKCLYW